jgi:hypothetical protein
MARACLAEPTGMTAPESRPTRGPFGSGFPVASIGTGAIVALAHHGRRRA